MGYCDSVEKSAEYLRLALPLMSRQAAALHPVSYAVWYEYVAGTNSALRTTVIVDIDHFKRVNDNYGHVFGDKVIRAVAQILRDNVKGKDTAARYGGKEFCILLPETSLDGASYVAEKIRSTVEKCRIKRSDNKEVVANVTVSDGRRLPSRRRTSERLRRPRRCRALQVEARRPQPDYAGGVTGQPAGSAIAGCVTW